MSAPYLIVGLGNPGEKYVHTRHNIGFLVIENGLRKWGGKLKRELGFKGRIAECAFDGKKVLLLQPMTYMNLSGQSVMRCAQYYKVPLEQILIVVDDVYLKFGTMRLRKGGSSGGHNGLKSVEWELKTQDYCRLRLGVGNGDLPGQSLEEYVLANFKPEEEKLLPDFLDKAVLVLETSLSQGTDAAMQMCGQ